MKVIDASVLWVRGMPASQAICVTLARCFVMNPAGTGLAVKLLPLEAH